MGIRGDVCRQGRDHAGQVGLGRRAKQRARDCGVTHMVVLSSIDADIDSPFCYALTNGFPRSRSAPVRRVDYRPIDSAAYRELLASTQDPWWAYAYANMFDSIRQQRWDIVTTTAA